MINILWFSDFSCCYSDMIRHWTCTATLHLKHEVSHGKGLGSLYPTILWGWKWEQLNVPEGKSRLEITALLSFQADLPRQVLEASLLLSADLGASKPSSVFWPAPENAQPQLCLPSSLAAQRELHPQPGRTSCAVPWAAPPAMDTPAAQAGPAWESS